MKVEQAERVFSFLLLAWGKKNDGANLANGMLRGTRMRSIALYFFKFFLKEGGQEREKAPSPFSFIFASPVQYYALRQPNPPELDRKFHYF